MKQTIFVTATNTDVGKTYAMKQLIIELSNQGHRVGVMKPIETGVIDEPLDAKALFELAKEYNPDLENLTLDDICPYQFKLPAAPYVAKGHEAIEIDVIHMALDKIKKYADIILMEGAGGIMVPVDENFFMVDFIEIFADNALLVVPSKLGSINDTLLNLQLLNQKKCPFIWAVNLFEDKESFPTVTAPFYQDHFKSYYSLQEDISTICKELTEISSITP